MTARPLILLALFAAAAASGCPAPASTPSRPVVIPSVPAGDYFPLAEGMQWKYEVVTQGATAQGTMTLTVGKVTKSGADTNAEGLRTLQLKLSDGTTHGSQVRVTWLKSRDGVWETIEGEGDERQVLQLPLKYGGGWNFGTTSMTLSAVDEVTVNGKAYKGALKVRAEDGDRLGYAYFAKDVGLVSWWGRKLPATGERQVGFGLLEHVKKGATPPPAPAPTASTPAPSASPTASAPPASAPTAAPSPATSAPPVVASPAPAPASTGAPTATPSPKAS